MILSFKVDENISKITNTPLTKDTTTEYYKCKFYPNEEIWKDSHLTVTFINDIGYQEKVHLGQYQNVLSCVIPPKFLLGSYLNMYITSDTDLKTNTISITLENHYITPEKKCNILLKIFEAIDAKIDNVIFKDNQILSYSNGQLVDTIYVAINEELTKEIIMDNLETVLDTNVDKKMKEYVRRKDVRFEDGIIYF